MSYLYATEGKLSLDTQGLEDFKNRVKMITRNIRVMSAKTFDFRARPSRRP